MAYKRSRSTFEADLHAPYAFIGTPLPEQGKRDDGSYLPLWKQDVRDDRGKRRLHGAFSGGWSAGYFNTVGSKEGWAPSTFVSSQKNRHKDGSSNTQQHVEEYMDDEDLADAAETQTLKTSQAFAGLGSSTQDELRAGGLMGLFKTGGDTMGLKLLRKMGWKDGQGIGPRVRRNARLDVGTGSAMGSGETYLFAPDNAEMIRFIRKTDRKGLGNRGGGGLSALYREDEEEKDDEEEEEVDDGKAPNHLRSALSLFPKGKNKKKIERGGIGVGILNDTGSDEEDPYEIGPKIKYNPVIGSDKKKRGKKVTAAMSNPSLKTAPAFVLKTAKARDSLRRCHDSRLPLVGFVLARAIIDLTTVLSKYAPPPIPSGWISLKDSKVKGEIASFLSTSDAANASSHDPMSRAAILGEETLPGKSIFDYISSSARDKLAAASGRKNLPPARGEVPEGLSISEVDQQKALWDQVPKLDRATAIAAIARGLLGPYADDEAKKARYRRYLEHHTDSGQPLPGKAPGLSDDEFLQEMNEFYNCARIFKPMTGFMASRFTTAKRTSSTLGSPASDTEQVSKLESKQVDPAEEAATMGMFGNMTRSVDNFFPTRLLCKRFNVKAPARSQPDDQSEASKGAVPTGARPPVDPFEDVHTLPSSGIGDAITIHDAAEAPSTSLTQQQKNQAVSEDQINCDRNEAVEGKAANADVLRAIFGDSDSE